MEVTLALWTFTILGIIGLIALDFVAVSRKPHEVMFKEALLWSVFYIGIAVAFGVALIVWAGSDFGSQYFAAYLVEKSLSVDNLFVFVVIFIRLSGARKSRSTGFPAAGSVRCATVKSIGSATRS